MGKMDFYAKNTCKQGIWIIEPGEWERKKNANHSGFII